jgi:RNA polymerase sigma factor (sigma-70 family)
VRLGIFLFFFVPIATNPSSQLGLSMKRGSFTFASLSSFQGKKGVNTMKPSDVQATIENQFDYLCKQVIKNERTNYLKHLTYRSTNEVTFSELDNQTIQNIAVSDSKPSDCDTFSVKGFLINVKSELLGEALKKVSNKQREILLLHYFLEMSDQEIGELLELHRSNVYRNRKKALKALKTFMEEKDYDFY